MISEIKRAKFRQNFEVTDTDGDGKITKRDNLATADNLITVLKLDPASPPAQLLKAQYARYWDALVASDLAQKDAVTVDEWIEHFNRISMDAKRLEEILLGRAELVMKLFDADHDQRISKAEWATFFSALGQHQKHAEMAFAKLDRDHDGHLTFDEIRTAYREFYASDDAEAPGNWFFGDYTKHLHSAI